MNKCTQVIDQWYWINEEFCCLIESYKTFLLQRPELSGGRGSQDNTSLTWVPHRVPGKELCVTHSLLFFVSKLSKQRDVRRVGRKDPLEKGMATHSSILPWRIPRIEEPGRLQSMESQRVGYDWATNVLLPVILRRFITCSMMRTRLLSFLWVFLQVGYLSRIGN